jgi:hypothetical protein
VLRLREQALTGTLPDGLQRHLQVARDERGRKAEGSDLASVASLKRWFLAPAEARLPAPSARADGRVRAWHAPFFALTDRPQKHTLVWP